MQLEMSKVLAEALYAAVRSHRPLFFMCGCVCSVDLAMPGSYIVLRNARIDMFRGSMRLAVNQWGKVEEAEPNQDFEVKVK